MKEYIKIIFHKLNTEITAELLADFNPYLCEAFKKTLPNKSIQSHAVVAGDQLYCPYRLPVDSGKCNFEDMSKQPDGRINMELNFQYLSINYGKMVEAVPAAALAQVVEGDIPKLAGIGVAAWNNLLFEKDYILVEFLYIGSQRG